MQYSVIMQPTPYSEHNVHDTWTVHDVQVRWGASPHAYVHIEHDDLLTEYSILSTSRPALYYYYPPPFNCKFQDFLHGGQPGRMQLNFRPS